MRDPTEVRYPLQLPFAYHSINFCATIPNRPIREVEEEPDRRTGPRGQLLPEVIDVDPKAFWVGLSLVPGIGPAKFRRLIESLGSPEAAWRARPALLAEAGLDRRAIESLTAARARLDLAQEMEKLRRLGVALLTLEDPDYPRPLRNIADPPPVL